MKLIFCGGAGRDSGGGRIGQKGGGTEGWGGVGWGSLGGWPPPISAGGGGQGWGTDRHPSKTSLGSTLILGRVVGKAASRKETHDL